MNQPAFARRIVLTVIACTLALIDRRFYRRKYDAARTLAASSTTICDEVDLNQLCTKMMAVVEDTMQPTQVSPWLRSSERRKEGQLHQP